MVLAQIGASVGRATATIVAVVGAALCLAAPAHAIETNTSATASDGIGWKLLVLIVLSALSITGAVLAWTRPRERKREDFEEHLEDDEFEMEDEDMEHASRAIDIDDPGIDRLYEAMYEPAPAPPVRPKLELVVGEPASEEPAVHPEITTHNEEFAWAVTSGGRRFF
jgi:hypothetical protein